MIAFLFLVPADPQPLGSAISDAIDAVECRQRPDKDEVVVCANRKRSERFRMPDRDGPFDPAGDVKSVMNEHVGWAAEGDVGTQSCSPVGVGGWTGCMVKGWKVERDQNQWKKNIPKRRW